jgi:tetratricopeptide (TPR) repeat protein
MSLDNANFGFDYFLAARNVAQFLLRNAPADDVVEFIELVLAQDIEGLCRRTDALSDVYPFYVLSLRKLNQFDKSRRMAEELVDAADIPVRCRLWAVSWLLAEYSLISRDSTHAFELIAKFERPARNLLLRDDVRRAEFFNNAAFAYAEFGKTDLAEKCLAVISGAIHKHAYATATLGLIHIRKGHIEKGTKLYEEAVSLAATDLDKVRIRQKLNLELARIASPENPSKARRLLSRVIDEKHGEVALVRQARRELQLLPRQGL